MSGDKIKVLGHRQIEPRLLIVSYNLMDDTGKQIGGGFSRIEASTSDSMIRQMNQMLSGRRYKITEVCPVI